MLCPLRETIFYRAYVVRVPFLTVIAVYKTEKEYQNEIVIDQCGFSPQIITLIGDSKYCKDKGTGFSEKNGIRMIFLLENYITITFFTHRNF